MKQREILHKDRYGAVLEIRKHLITKDLLVITTANSNPAIPTAVEVTKDQVIAICEHLKRWAKR